MNSNRNRNRFLPAWVGRGWPVFVLACLFICVVFCTRFFRKQKVWESVKLKYTGDDSFFSQEKEGYGIISDGPGFHLPAGTYEIQWQIDGDGENRIHISCDNGVVPEPAIFMTIPGKWGSGSFSLADAAHNLNIQIEFASGTWMRVDNIRLTSPFCRDEAFSIAFLVGFAVLLYIFWLSGRITRERAAKLVLLLAAAAFASIPSLAENTRGSTDTVFHAARIFNLADAIRKGQCFVRLGGYSYNGYGAVTSVFYPGLFLYPFAVLVLLGVSITYALQIYLIAMHLLTAFASYYSAKRMLRDDQAALCASILYTCADFRIFQGYAEPRIGVAAVMAVFPFFLLGLWYVLFDDRTKWPWLTMGAFLISQNHLLSAGIYAAFAGVVGLIALPRLVREKRILSVLIAVVCTVLLCLPQLVPFFTYRADGVTTMPNGWLPQKTALEVAELFSDSRNIGMLLPACAAVFLAELSFAWENGREERQMAVWFAVALLFAWSSTVHFPWNYLSVLTHGATDILQFPMRMLQVTIPLIALCGGYAIPRIFKGKGICVPALCLVLCVVAGTGNIQRLMSRNVYLEFGRIPSPVLDYAEYLYEDTRPLDTLIRQPITTEGIRIDSFKKDGYRIKSVVHAEKEGSITFPLFAYTGLSVSLDGERMPWIRGINNRLTVLLPEGTTGALEIDYRPLPIWKISDVISIVTAFLLVLRACMTGKRKLSVPKSTG